MRRCRFHFKKNYIIILIFSLLNIQETITSQWVRRLGSTFSIGLPIGLTVYDQMSAYHQVLRQRQVVYEGLQPASEKLECWIKKQVPTDYTDEIAVKVDALDCMKSTLFALSPQTIGIGPFSAQYLEQHIDEGYSNDYVSFANVGIKHEVGHLYHKDVEKQLMVASGLFGIGVQFALCGTTRLLRSTAHNVSHIPKSKALFLTKSIAAGLTKWLVGRIISNVIRLGYVRFIEARADQFAYEHCTSPQALRGAAAIHEERAEGFKELYIQQSFNPDGSKTFKDATKEFEALTPLKRNIGVRLVAFLHDPMHPDPIDRARWLRNAADRLERQASGNSRALP